MFSLETLNITSPLLYVSSEAFYGCTYLTSVKLPDTMKIIYSNAFKNCTHLVSVDL